MEGRGRKSNLEQNPFLSADQYNRHGFRLDVSRLDSGDYIISEDDEIIIDGFLEILKGAQTEDIDHIFGHIRDNRDIFITGDPHFLNHKGELYSKFGVLVVKPEDAVAGIERKFPA